jgi:hypothetical protein
LNTKYLALLPLCLLACDDAVSIDGLAADVQGAQGASASDVLVVIFDGRDAGPASPAPALAREPERRATSESRVAPVSEVEALPVEAPRPSIASDTRWLVNGGNLVLAQGEEAAAVGSREAEATLAHGHPPESGLFVAVRRPLALPAEAAALAGAEVKLYDHDREVCVARVDEAGRFALTATLIHLRDEWQEEGEEASAPRHDASEVFDLGVTLLEAPLVPLMGDCSKGLWAAPIEAPRPVLYREAAASPKLARQAIAAFRAVPAWREAQAAMVEALAGMGEDTPLGRARRWDTLYGARPEVKLYRADRGGREIAVVHADSWDGCGSEGQRMVALFEVVHEGKKPRFVELASLVGAAVPAGLVDLEGDGVVEVFSGAFKHHGIDVERWHGDRPAPSEHNDWQDERYEPIHGLTVPDLTMYGCGC